MAEHLASHLCGSRGLDTLDRAFRAQHLSQHAAPGVPDGFGQPFTIRAILQGPTGAAVADDDLVAVRPTASKAT